MRPAMMIQKSDTSTFKKPTNLPQSNADKTKTKTKSLTPESTQVDPYEAATAFQPASISWRNVNVWSKATKSCWDSLSLQPSEHGTQIIKNVSGKVAAGTTLAIMGASGAGKTTLLNVLNARNLSNFYVDGVIQINGRLADIDMITSMSAYVQQEDLFLPSLTVREHLVFQSLVRIDETVPDWTKVHRINQVLQELGLDKCADTKVGGGRSGTKGISGGELKRLSFAVEILTNPSIMFCDEPTSGLDSFMASNLVTIINKLATAGRTIICTIHQPSSETFDLFQNLLLLADGRVAYFGPLRDATKYFSTIGLKCPENHNPADFFIYNLAVIPGQEIKCRKKINRICDYYEKLLLAKQDPSGNVHQSSFANVKPTQKQSRYKVSRCQQYQALTWRSHLTVIREPTLTYVRLSQALINAVVLSIIFCNQHYDQKGVGNINGALFLLLVNMTMQNAFAVMNVFCSELPVFLREHNNGMYQVDAYFVCKNLAELPIFVFIPMVFVLIYYYIINLYPTFDSFLYTTLVGIVLSTCGVSFGYFISCICRDTDVALSFGPPMVMPFQLLGGYFINTATVAPGIRWARFLSWFYYGFDLLTVNQWWNVDTIDCSKNHSNICYHNGKEVLDFLALGQHPLWLDWLGLLLMILLLRSIAFLSLLYAARKR